MHRFSVSSSWDRAAGSGRVRNKEGTFDVVHRGAAELGGAGGAVNPEELLGSAVATCFVQTWAIFVGKLGLNIGELRLEATCTVEADPAGGFRVTAVELFPEVPSGLWEQDRERVEKTLQLAEKYCIISKAVRAEGKVTVTPRAI